ncbi:MAG: FAD-binding protein [Chloroflexi bacterium]|nr:FAD-binding protein [Chloroflexota bacterium]
MGENVSYKHELESDVVVIGYGGAGAAAAITAHDSGASVTILEKMPTPGGNTRLSEISFFTPSADKVSDAIEHIEALCFGATDHEVIRAYVEEAAKNKEWLEQLGGKIEPTALGQARYPYVLGPAWPTIPGARAMTNSRVVSDGDDVPYGVRLWTLLSTNVSRRERIRVMTSTPARELVTNEQGEVTGVIAEQCGENILLKAKRAVILTCGGFASNEAMKELFLPYKPIYSMGSPGNTGDGIVMAQKVGAALWHMTAIKAWLTMKTPKSQFSFCTSYCSPKYIYVNKDGRRFTNETGWEIHSLYWALCCHNPKRSGYPRLPIYGICDKAALDSGPLGMHTNGIYGGYRWSPDNSAEVARGWIIEGKTISELARQISVDETTLEQTIATYNNYCRAGADPEYGRSSETLEPIDTAPYYAIELWPSLTNTMGGPRRDHRARVLNSSGQPVPRLYAAGELGSLWGFLYNGGGNGGEILAVGRIAGRNAAAEQPWC